MPTSSLGLPWISEPIKLTVLPRTDRLGGRRFSGEEGSESDERWTGEEGREDSWGRERPLESRPQRVCVQILRSGRWWWEQRLVCVTVTLDLSSQASPDILARHRLTS